MKGKRSRGQGQRLQQGEIAHALLVSFYTFLKTLMAQSPPVPKRRVLTASLRSLVEIYAGLQGVQGSATRMNARLRPRTHPSPSLSALHRAPAGARGLLEAGARRQGNAGSAHLVVDICRVSVGGKAVGRHTLCMCICIRVSEITSIT